MENSHLYILILHILVEESKEKTLKSILEAKNKVRSEIAVLKNKLKLAKETIQSFKEEIAKSQEVQYVI